MVYPREAAPGAVDKDKVLALHDYEGFCGLCQEPCDSTQDELNALCCTFEPCPSPSIYHQSCLEAYLKSIRLDKQRKTGFACPRNCGKAAKGEKACPGRISKSHPIYARNDNSKKRRKAKMPDPVVVPPPATAGKRPPLPKTSPKGPEEKRSPEERSKGVAGGKSKAVPILVASSAKHAAPLPAAAQEEARQEIQLLRARSSGGRDSPRSEGEGGLQKKEPQEMDHEYTAPRGPASLADFAVTITKVKGRGFSKVAASSHSPEARKGQEQASAPVPLEKPQPDAAPPAAPRPSDPVTPALHESAPLVAAVGGPPKSPPSTVLRQEEATKIRSPSKSQRKHQQRLAARHLREKQDAAPPTPGAALPPPPLTQPGDNPAAATAPPAGPAGVPALVSPSLHQPLETVQELAAFPSLPSPKAAAAPLHAAALPALRLSSPHTQPPPAVAVGAPASPGGQSRKAGLEPWGAGCLAALRERKVTIHAAQLQGLGYFSAAQCVAAVRACGADLGLCCDWLLSGGAKLPPSPPDLDIAAELARLADLAAAGPLPQAALEAAVVRCQGDIDAALRPPSSVGLPAPPMSIMTTPALPAGGPPPAVSPGSCSDFGAISRPSSSSSSRSAGSPWGGLDSRGSCSEASSFFSTSAWGSLGPSLVTSPPSAADSGTCFSPFGGGFASDLLRTTSLRMDATPPGGKPAWPAFEGGADGGGSDALSGRDRLFLSRSVDPFGSSGVRSSSSVEGSFFSDPDDSSDSHISEATQSTVTSVAAAVLQDSFDDPVPPPPPPPSGLPYGQPYSQHALWGDHFQEAPPPPHRMFQPLAPGHQYGGPKHTNPGARNGGPINGYGPNDQPPAIWGFNGTGPLPYHSAFSEHAFYDGAGRTNGMMAGAYGREQARGSPFAEGPRYGGNGRQPQGVGWREGAPGGSYGYEAAQGQHHWADQDRLVTQLLSQLLV